MRYRVALFALLREKTGMPVWVHDTAAPIKASELMAAFFDAHHQLAALRGVTRLAINQTFTSGDPHLAEEDELALIPPVSGG